MAGAVAVAIIDNRSRWDKIKAAITSMPTVDVGIIDRPDIAVYAAVHEYGSSDGHTPARRWLMSSIEKNSGAVNSAIAAATAAVLDGRLKSATAADLAGKDIADIVRAHVNGGSFPPPLGPATVKRKGFAKQMVDTGVMRDAITSRVNGGR